MEVFFKKIQIIALIIVLIGVLAFISRPSYAGGAYSEASYIAKSPKYYSSRKCAVIRLKWSKAYSRLSDGTVRSASGYEIQYADNKAFKKAKKKVLSGDTFSTEITLKKLNTRKKFKKYINKYRVRIRSYVRANGEKKYSKWVSAAKAKKVKVFSPVVLESIKAKRNTVTGKWQAVSGCDGYLVYSRKEGNTRWRKNISSTRKSLTRFSIRDLDFGRNYEFAVLSYKYITTPNPNALQTSVLYLLNSDTDKYKLSLPEFKLNKPSLRVGFRNESLLVAWNSVPDAEMYEIEYSSDNTFPIATVQVVTAEAMEGVDSYYKELGDLNRDDELYLRIRATGKYKNKKYYSKYSDVQTFKYSDLTYQIKFNWNNAQEGAMRRVTVRENELFDLPANRFVRAGYEFAGWSLEKNNEINMDKFQYGKPDFMNEHEVVGLANAGELVNLYACWRGVGIEAAADWAKRIANNDEFTYGNVVRNQCWYCDDSYHTYNCNSFVAAAYTHGMPFFSEGNNGSTYPNWWVKKGFTKIGNNIPAAEIQKGDIICCWKTSENRWGHVMIALGPTKVAHAARKGTDPESIRIDDMETRLGKYSKYCVLRLVV